MHTYTIPALPGHTVALRQRSYYTTSQLVVLQTLAGHQPGKGQGRISWAKQVYRYAQAVALQASWPGALAPWVLRYTGLRYGAGRTQQRRSATHAALAAALAC